MARERIIYLGDSNVPHLRRETWRTTTLYRLFDEAGVLLYIGITRRPDLRERFNAHRRTQSWWTEIAGIEIEYYPAEHLALAAEVAAIRAEKPLHNRRSAVAV